MILLIDNYDSFSYNLYQAVGQVNPDIKVVRNDELTVEEIRQMAVKTFQVLGCSGVSRIDFMIDKETDKVYVNEINPIPGSLAFYLWEPLGKPYAQLLDDMVKLALKREREEKSMLTSFDSNILQNANLSGAKGVKK